jgi:conjugative transfer region lipoprotein (TIGR03751 family)
MNKIAMLIMMTYLAGCTTSQETLLPVDPDTSMMTLWSQRSGGAQALLEQRSQLRSQLRRPLNDPAALTTVLQNYTRTAENETRSQFVRLPDPDMVMYIWPHLSGNSPVPGYSTVFPLYTRVQYAMPGERTEDL